MSLRECGFRASYTTALVLVQSLEKLALQLYCHIPSVGAAKPQSQPASQSFYAATISKNFELDALKTHSNQQHIYVLIRWGCN